MADERHMGSLSANEPHAASSDADAGGSNKSVIGMCM